MRHLRNNVHEKFILSHVIRPYQTEIGFSAGGRAELADMKKIYPQLVELAEENPHWFDMVTNRIALIYREIDHDVFPFDEFSNLLLGRLKELGVKINPRDYSYER